MDAAHAGSAVFRARFEREARAAASLQSPHVVQVLDYGVEGDTPYIVMELLVGEDLRRRLSRERRLSLAATSRILSHVARGLGAAHEAHLVHRDLKPANVFLAGAPGAGGDEVVKILDFGIAKDLMGEHVGESTRTGELVGSPHYMSPEQVRGAKDIDHRSDLWALSVIVYRSLTGQLPFRGDVFGAVIAQVLADPVPVATHVAPDLPPEVDAFFARGFARDREARFQTAEEMAAAFAALVAEVAQGAGRWAEIEDPPTRPMMTSSYPLAAAGDLMLPPSGLRPEMPSIPTESMGSSSDGAGPGSGALGGTGGPVIHTAPPPPLPRAALPRWLPLGGVVLGVLLGGGAFVALRAPGGGVPQGAAAGAAAPPAVTASAAVAVSATASATAVAAAEPVSSAVPSASVNAGVAEAPSATASAKVVAPPPGKGPLPKKGQNWGF